MERRSKGAAFGIPKSGCPEQSGLCDDAVTFLLWKVARPQAEHLLKTKQRFRRGGEFLSERSERNQRIAGGRGFWERPAADALVFQEPRSPGPPVYGGRRRGASALAAGAVPS